MHDPYVCLAVPRSATADDIKKSFRELAKRLHPDANSNDPKTAALFAELNAAHEILRSEEKRRAFDRGEIDAEGKRTHQVIAPARPRTWHNATRLLMAMVLLATTSMLIARSLTREENINANSDGGDRVLARVDADEEHAPTIQLWESGVQSEPRLMLSQNVSYAIPLGIQVGGKTDGATLEIIGLPSGMTISKGRELGEGRWRILATDVGNATIDPPAGFSGTIDLTIELRLVDDTVVDRGSLHLESPRPTKAQDPNEPEALSESFADKALATVVPADLKVFHRAAELRLDREQIELLVRRGQKLISEGDVGAARVLLQRAAEARDERAALALGATYDPIMLAKLQARGVAADVSLAHHWYEKANELGSLEAQDRLNLLTSVKADDGE
jgi:DnaJ domain